MTEIRTKYLEMKTAIRTPTMVQHLREIRNQVSLEIMNMSLAEERAHLSEQLAHLKAKREKAKS